LVLCQQYESCVARGYYRFKTGYLRPIGIPEVDTGEGDLSELENVKERYQNQEYDVIRKRAIELAEEGKESTVYNLLCYLVNERIEAQNQYESLNLDLSDHLGNYSEGNSYTRYKDINHLPMFLIQLCLRPVVPEIVFESGELV